MKRLPTLLYTLAVLASSAAASLAQTPAAGGPPDPQLRMDQIAKELSLTDGQKTQFAAIVDEEHVQLSASMKDERAQNTDIQTAHQNHQKIEDAAMAKLKPILSADQFKKYQGIVEAEAYARHHRAPAAAPAN